MTRFVAIVFFAGLLVSQQKGAISHPAGINEKNVPLGVSWQDGDIVLREGKGVISNFMRATSSREKRFSHAGIVIHTRSGPRIFHVIGTSGDPDGGLVADKPEDFCNRNLNKSIMVIRFPLLPDHLVRLRSAVASCSRNPVSFDNNFDLESDHSYYCTEFIYKMIRKATGHTEWIPLTQSENGPYVGLDDLYLNASAEKLVDQTLSP
jgi:hypothetical protein